MLYSTNTICIGNHHLINTLLCSAAAAATAASDDDGHHLHLQQRVLIPLHHLALLTRLELIWDWALFLRPDKSQMQTEQRAAMRQSLDGLPHALPNLASAVLSYGDSLYYRSVAPSTCMAEIDRELMLPICGMASKLKKNGNGAVGVVVELPTNTFRPLQERAWRRGGKIYPGRSLVDIRIWWEPEPERKSEPEPGFEFAAGPGPEPEPEHDSKQTSAGFWVKSGIESNLFFDYLGQARTMATEPSVLF